MKFKLLSDVVLKMDRLRKIYSCCQTFLYLIVMGDIPLDKLLIKLSIYAWLENITCLVGHALFYILKINGSI